MTSPGISLSFRTNRDHSRFLAIGALAVAVWINACGDGGTAAPPPDPPRPTTVSVTPAAVQLVALDETAQLTAEVRDQHGRAMPGAAITWTSSNASVAAVDAAGLVTAADNGTTAIAAAAGSVSGSAAVMVAQEVRAVAVSPDADTVVAGDTLRLRAEAADANGYAVASAEFTWASSDTLVARVDDFGLVTGVTGGEAAITAATGVATGRAELVVTPAVGHRLSWVGRPSDQRVWQRRKLRAAHGQSARVGPPTPPRRRSCPEASRTPWRSPRCWNGRARGYDSRW